MRASLPALLASLTLLHASPAAVNADLTPEQSAFFEGKVRPILVDHCYKCHSIENAKSKGGLTLDTREGLLKGGEIGPAIKPGDPTSSPLIKAINYQDKDLQMPPTKEGGRLSDAQIETLTAWVKMGAPDPRSDSKLKLSGLTEKARSHWAYQPVAKPAQPPVKNKAWCFTGVDTFILSKLEAQQLLPAPDASRETLLRRATYDLTGLPPSPQEVRDFVSDVSPQAFARVVDRLLASPAYGERWGRYWLDTARYADTIGGERNNGKMDYRYPYAWTYRDYVVKAFNDDKPYDQFIVEQLAADKLPDITPDDPRLAALGFLTVGERFRNPNDVINDRIDTVSKGFLAMTVACARCHDHKFDPIPTKDYYALHGVFASSIEPPEKPIIAMPPLDQLADFQEKLAALEQENRDAYYQAIAEEATKFRFDAAGYLLASSRRKNQASDDQMAARNELIKKRRLDPDLVNEISKNVRPNDPVISPLRLFLDLDPTQFATKAEEIIAKLTAPPPPEPTGKVAERRPNRPSTPPVNPLVIAAFKNTKPQSIEDVADIYGKLFASIQPRAKEFYTAASTAKSMPLPGFDPALAQLLEIPFKVQATGSLDMNQLRDLANRGPKKFVNRSENNLSKINHLLLTNPGAPVRAMVINDLATPKDSPVLLRGQAETKGDIIPRRFLEVLSPGGSPKPFAKNQSGRLELAQSIASKSNPLTARVLVNRLWMHHFGEGFVPTLDDLGTQSEPPSHPELLDYLAASFIEKNWSIKQLHRIVMLSHVYQESSETNPHNEKIDSQNRFLWRANIRRLDFESMRDSLLAFSGKLDRTLGGQPVNLTEEPYSYRRSVYGYIDRGNLPELMQSFDFSDPDMTNSKRSTSIVPQQALFLMNSPMAIDVARRILTRPEVASARDDLGRTIAVYRVIFQRNPKPSEIQIALKFIASETPDPSPTTRAPTDPKITAKIVARASEMKKPNRPNGAIQNEGTMVDRKPLSPWESYAQALLFSNEAAYIN